MKTEEKISGIYKIENVIDGKVYIGQSVNLKNRIASHKSNLKHNRHHNSYLQNAYNKYGLSNFNFSIIRLCEIEKLDYFEKYYIALYNSTDRKYGYNREGGGNLKKEVSDETKKKISEAGKKRFEDPEEHIKNQLAQRKRFEDPEEHIKLSIAQKKRYKDPSQLELNSKLRLKFYASEKGKQKIENYKNIMSTYWNNKEWCDNMMIKKSNIIIQFNLDMTIVKLWNGSRQIERELTGVYRPQLKQCLSNTFGLYGNGYKNFIWLEKDYYKSLTKEQINEYIKKFKNYDFEKEKTEIARLSKLKNKVVQLNLDMTLVKIWNGAEEPQRTTEFKKSQIIRCCKHQSKTNIYKGYIWMYEKEYLEFNNKYN